MLVRMVPLGSIAVEGQCIRVDQMDERIVELAADISAHGLLQPLVVAELGAGRYQLLAGRRRLTACERLRWVEVPCHVYPIGEQPVRAVALRENLLRESMTIAEECDAVAQLHFEEGRSPDQIANLLSRSRGWVLSRLAVRSLPPDLRDPVYERRLAVGAAMAIARLSAEGDRRFLCSQAIQNGLSVGAVEHLVASHPEVAARDTTGAAVVLEESDAQGRVVVFLRCSACGREKPLDGLRLIRVCDDGCGAAVDEAH